MLRNYLKIAYRNFIRNKLHSTINVFGLAIGLAAAILIILYIKYELSYDKFHHESEKVYRIWSEVTMPDGSKTNAPASSGYVAPLLTEQIPGIEHIARVRPLDNEKIRVDDQLFTKEIYYVDSSFLKILTFPLIKGNPDEALKKPNSLVLARDVAENFFGTTDVLNKTIKLNGHSVTITGVMENVPANSHIQFDVLGSFTTLDVQRALNRNGMGFVTYFRLKHPIQKKEFDPHLDKVADVQYEEQFGERLEVDSYAQPIERVHLYSNGEYELSANSDIRHVYVFGFLAFFIVLIAMINFVNLVTARSEKRSREIGMRKVCGATRADVIRQFLAESMMIALIAVVLAIGIVELLLPSFNNIIERNITLSIRHDGYLFAVFILFGLFVGLLSGIYPAFFLSRFRPSKVLKGIGANQTQARLFRKALVIFQFTVAVFLIASVLVIYKQLNFMKNKELGFDDEQVVVFQNLSDELRDNFKTVQAELLGNPNIESVSGSHSLPGTTYNIQTTQLQGSRTDQSFMVHENVVRPGYVKTMGYNIIKGRDFHKDSQKDQENSALINESLAKKLGGELVLGKKINVWDDQFEVIGIIKDYHYKSLKHKIEPLVLDMRYSGFNFYTIRFNATNTGDALNYLKAKFQELDPYYVPDYYYLNQRFAQQYREQEQSSTLALSGAILAIAISVLGLFALSSFTVEQRTKEIGIRKVMGGTPEEIAFRITRNMLKWVLIATLIAWPLTYVFMKNWLQDFAYHIRINVDVFLLSGLIGLGIAIITVSFQSIKAANTNPVDTVRYE